MSSPGDEHIATSSQTVGPYFSFGLTTNAALGQLTPAGTPGGRLRLIVRILDGQAAPVPDAMIELWHPDHAGRSLFGRLGTDTTGTCVFEIPPLVSSRESGDAAHLNLCLFMRGLLRHLYTRVYVPGDAAGNDVAVHDAILARVPQYRRQTLMATPVPDSPGTWRFDVRLQGEHETVFFDL
jgi:protocatechuate 3,4-dioxygenase, alpha subunit